MHDNGVKGGDPKALWSCSCGPSPGRGECDGGDYPYFFLVIYFCEAFHGGQSESSCDGAFFLRCVCVLGRVCDEESASGECEN